ncbi:hypothetical protein HaLaN_22248, partial [Haematococcus lacustris]
MAAGLRRREV